MWVINSFLALVFFFNFSLLFGQETKVITSINNSNFLYKNYPNIMELGYQGVCDEEQYLKIICDECDSIEIINKYKYYIYVNSTRSVNLEFYFVEKENNMDIFIGNKTIYVVPLPDPNIIFGNFEAKEIVYLNNLRVKRFFASYPPSVPIVACFNVVEWKVLVNDKIFSGKGPNFSDELNQYLFGKKIR